MYNVARDRAPCICIDASSTMAAIICAVASGDLTVSEAAELSRPVEAYVRALEVTEFEKQLCAPGAAHAQ
jgi:hypothetical protein